jgi:hypothetical protein
LYNMNNQYIDDADVGGAEAAIQDTAAASCDASTDD